MTVSKGRERGHQHEWRFSSEHKNCELLLREKFVFSYMLLVRKVSKARLKTHKDLVYTVNLWWTTNTLFPKYCFRTVEIELHAWYVWYHHIVGFFCFFFLNISTSFSASTLITANLDLDTQQFGYKHCHSKRIAEFLIPSSVRRKTRLYGWLLCCICQMNSSPACGRTWSAVYNLAASI